jgi:CheY-like chemotaxis protein
MTALLVPIVDDYEDIIKTLGICLRQEGHRAVTAMDASSQALSVVILLTPT